MPLVQPARLKGGGVETSVDEYFVNLFNHVREAIVIQDNDGRILRVNGEFEKVFGYGGEEAIGRLIDELIVPPESAAEGLRFTEAVTRGETFTFETRRRRKDGSLVDVSLICAPILIQGRQKAAYGIYRDIGERKLAEARLAESHRRITDSLEYARLIQKSLLPEPGLLGRHIPDHFVLYRPREMVGGDFYSLAADPEGFLLAVADCTGHGVPGAFMTMSAHAILVQVLAKAGPGDPARILAEMNRAMKGALHQHGPSDGPGHLDNGLDMALARFDPGARRLRFAGARLALWLFLPGGEFRELRGNRHSLGYRRSDPDFPFTANNVALPPGTSCYLFTDGILDQHGGTRGFSFGARRLREALRSLQGLPMAAQGPELERALSHYRGANPQRDDITLLGLRTAPESGQE